MPIMDPLLQIRNRTIETSGKQKDDNALIQLESSSTSITKPTSTHTISTPDTKPISSHMVTDSALITKPTSSHTISTMTTTKPTSTHTVTESSEDVMPFEKYVIYANSHMPLTTESGAEGIHPDLPSRPLNDVDFALPPRAHFINDPNDKEAYISIPRGDNNEILPEYTGSGLLKNSPINRGSVTPAIQHITESGVYASKDDPNISGIDAQNLAMKRSASFNLEGYEIPDDQRGEWQRREKPNGDAMPSESLSPVHPFIRSDANIARAAILRSYNRTKLPIADIEHRKAFRHIFITRPECYIMSVGETRPVLSDQCAHDEVMMSSYQRFPHISEILSPVYVCQNPAGVPYANWNYLLTNRVQGLNVSGITLGTIESMAKGVHGSTIQPGGTITSMDVNNLELTFRDTKWMDVYENIRAWMWYIHKRRTGELFPPFNGYQKTNSWGSYNGFTNSYASTHPYDRALEYCASLYDIIVDETGTRILYWCKYYGIYPTSLSNGMLNNSNNAPLGTSDGASISASFRYQYKEENLLKTLAEFNFNAGIANQLGERLNSYAQNMPNSQSFIDHGLAKPYIGAGGMFVGDPYIVVETDGVGRAAPFLSDTKIKSAYLYFLSEKLDNSSTAMNNGFEKSSRIMENQVNPIADKIVRAGIQAYDLLDKVNLVNFDNT